MIIQKHKIVFAGSMGAGKTEAIKSLSDIPVLATEAINTDQASNNKLYTTVGIDYGEIKIDDHLTIGLYGTPGQERFDFIWSIICQGAIGAIILIDHNSKSALQDLENYVEFFQEYTKYIAIGITHTDQSLEKSTEIYRNWLKEHELYHPLFMVDARQKQDIKLLLEALITSIEVNHNIT